MQIIRDYRAIPLVLAGSALAIGNFDGVHLGHKAVIEEAKSWAGRHQAPLMVMNFHPHPRSYFQPSYAPLATEPAHIRFRRLKALGIDGLLLLRFNHILANMSAEDFVRQILVDALRVRHVTVGEDFRFGKGREGTVQFLQQEAMHHRFGFSYVPPVMMEGEPVSSSRIRMLVGCGEMEQAAALLGRPYQLYGRVIHGNKRGREMQVPTLNIQVEGLHLPRFGVYAVEYALVDSADCGRHPPVWKKGIANLGLRPTFGINEQARLEVHAFETLGEVYGQYVRVRLLKHLRDEQAFDTAEALKAQIMEDVQQVRKWFKLL